MCRAEQAHLELLPARQADSKTLYASHIWYMFMNTIFGKHNTFNIFVDNTPLPQ